MSIDFAYDFDSKACESCGGKCCVGESGYIFCSIKELEAMSEFMQMPFETFTKTYVKKVGYKFSLIEKKYQEGFACIFFDEVSKMCSIYPVRPKQCRDFPFWKLFKEEEHLDFLLKECKGIRLKSERRK